MSNREQSVYRIESPRESSSEERIKFIAQLETVLDDINQFVPDPRPIFVPQVRGH